jgi:hypothetical protein
LNVEDIKSVTECSYAECHGAVKTCLPNYLSVLIGPVIGVQSSDLDDTLFDNWAKLLNLSKIVIFSAQLFTRQFSLNVEDINPVTGLLYKFVTITSLKIYAYRGVQLLGKLGKNQGPYSQHFILFGNL